MNNTAKSARSRRGNPLASLFNRWWDRLLGAVSDRSLSAQEAEYAAHRTSRDYVWNTVGFSVWGMLFPVLTIVATQTVGVEQAGRFSLAFVTANLLYFLGNYGVRTYQVSDISQAHSFKDYQVNRLLTVVVMVIVCFGYCSVRAYSPDMLAMSMGICAYKAIDALGDVYEGRLQQHDKLYLGGISLTIRSLAAFVAFCVLAAITRNLVVAGAAMAVAAGATLVFVTVPLALFETPRSRPLRAGSVVRLFKQCAPLFIALFLYALIDNMPKFVMDGVLSYDNQLYFNALYFPAQAILLAAGFAYKPLLVRMANAWADPARRRSFDLFIVAMSAIIVALTVAGVVLMGTIGIPLMSFLYGIDFGEYRELSFIMLAAGGVTAGIDFLYQVITILRRQKVVTELYVITFVFAVLILILTINLTGLDGAVVGYLVVMAILFVLLVREYVSVRMGFARAGAKSGAFWRRVKPAGARGREARPARGAGLMSPLAGHESAGVRGAGQQPCKGADGEAPANTADDVSASQGNALSSASDGQGSTAHPARVPVRVVSSAFEPARSSIMLESADFGDGADADGTCDGRVRLSEAERAAILARMEEDERESARRRLKARQTDADPDDPLFNEREAARARLRERLRRQ